MKSSLLALVVAASLSMSSNVVAQTSVDAGAAVSADATASANSGGGTAGADLTVDANADGSIDAGEIASANAAITASGNASVVLDADGNGTVTPEEANAVEAALAGTADTVSCGDAGLGALTGIMTATDPAALSAATNIQVVVVSDCAADDVTATLAGEGATNVRKALEANAAVVAAIQARGATLANVLGASANADSVTVYVASSASNG
jgi:hypothetical protein